MIGNADLISMTVGVLLPWLTGLITRANAHPKIKGIVLLALSAASAVLTALGAALATGEVFDWRSTVFSALSTFVVGQALHSGVYRHLTQYRAVASFGGFIGRTATPVAPTPK